MDSTAVIYRTSDKGLAVITDAKIIPEISHELWINGEGYQIYNIVHDIQETKRFTMHTVEVYVNPIDATL